MARRMIGCMHMSGTEAGTAYWSSRSRVFSRGSWRTTALSKASSSSMPAIDRESGSRALYGVQDERGDPIVTRRSRQFPQQRLLDWQRQDGHRAATGSQIGSVDVTCLTFEGCLQTPITSTFSTSTWRATTLSS